MCFGKQNGNPVELSFFSRLKKVKKGVFIPEITDAFQFPYYRTSYRKVTVEMSTLILPSNSYSMHFVTSRYLTVAIAFTEL